MYSPFVTLLVCLSLKAEQLGDILEKVPLYVMVLSCILLVIFLLLYFAALLLANFITLFSLCNFILNTLVYSIMGVVVNVGIVTPFVALFLVVTTNFYLCYTNMPNKCKEVKKMILKWQKELQINSSDPEGTIRTQLFWFVCDRVLPIKSEICRMLQS